MVDNIPYVEKMIEVGDLEIGIRAEPFMSLQRAFSDDGKNKMASR